MFFTIWFAYFEIIYVTTNFTVSKINNNVDDFKIIKRNCKSH